jgi:sulfite reductase alpha subunit
MINYPRQSSYIRLDGWDAAAEEFFEKRAGA